jgi:CheY-like chemotaxis protein
MREAKKAGVPLKRGSETILLVDDEKRLRELGADMPTKFGYTVLTAADGESAIELYRKEKERKIKGMSILSPAKV